MLFIYQFPEKVGSEGKRTEACLSVHGSRKEIRRLVLLRRYLKVGMRGPHKMYSCKSEPGHFTKAISCLGTTGCIGLAAGGAGVDGKEERKKLSSYTF